MLPADDHACVALTIDGAKIFMQPYRRFLPLLLLPMATMPLALYWLHKRRYYAYLTLTLLLFFMLASYLMLRSSGNPWRVLLWCEMLFGFFYLPFAMWGWLNHKIGTSLLVPVRLGIWPFMVLVVLAAALQMLFMMLWSDQAHRVMQWLTGFETFFNQLFLLQEPVHLGPYLRPAGVLIALLPTVTLLNLTQIWCKKRAICNRHPTPWWMLLLVLVILSVAVWTIHLQCASCIVGHLVDM